MAFIRPFKRKAASTEPTKTWWYVGIDLGLKLLSALSILALGVAGLWWQRTNAAQAERQRTAEQLRRHGVTVVDETPDELAPALADAYLALKAAGRL